MGGCEAVKTVVYQRTGNRQNMQAGRDVWLHDLVAKQPDTCDPVWLGAEHPLFTLYTSGSTGSPKGVQHSTGGYLLWAMLTMRWVFDIKPTDTFWCTADIGWVTGHAYIAYGPLAVGATEESATSPATGRCATRPPATSRSWAGSTTCSTSPAIASGRWKWNPRSSRIRSIAKGETITQDVSTLENPAVPEQLKQAL